MDRPTCKTCTCFAPDHGVMEGMDGECRERLHMEHDSYRGVFPEVRTSQWCAKHQDFKEYIDSLKHSHGQPHA